MQVFAPAVGTDHEVREQVQAEDRRDYGRYCLSHKFGVRLIARPSFQPMDGVLVEFSQHGIGMLLDRPLTPGTVIAIQLRSWHSGRSCILSGTVRHAKQEEGSDFWRIGCSLSRALASDEIDGLLLNSHE